MSDHGSVAAAMAAHRKERLGLSPKGGVGRVRLERRAKRGEASAVEALKELEAAEQAAEAAKDAHE